MAKDVKCDVESCVYCEHHKCSASEISVCNCGCHKANTTDETECETFRLK